VRITDDWEKGVRIKMREHEYSKSKEKHPERVPLYCIPLVMQLVIHVLASGGFEQSTVENIQWRVLRAVLVTAFSMLLGEGYGSLAFVLAGLYDRIGAYIAVIIFSVISAGASLAGYMLSGIEGLDCLWMTLLFWCIDLFLIVFSVIRIVQLIKGVEA